MRGLMTWVVVPILALNGAIVALIVLATGLSEALRRIRRREPTA